MSCCRTVEASRRKDCLTRQLLVQALEGGISLELQQIIRWHSLTRQLQVQALEGGIPLDLQQIKEWWAIRPCELVKAGCITFLL